jgi:hypothetical protein
MHNHPQAIGPITGGPVDQMVHSQNPFPYQVYTTPLHPGPRGMHPANAGPPQTWQGANSSAPQQTHMAAPQMLPRPQPYRDDSWDGSYDHASQAPGPIVGGPNAPGYDYRYRDDQTDWVGGPNDYYDPSASTLVLGSDHILTFHRNSNMINPMTRQLSTCQKRVHPIQDLPQGLPRRLQRKPVVASVPEPRLAALFHIHSFPF